jgi:hypothetical protein
MAAPGGLTMWYFAYGSNMQRDTLAGRRKIDFTRAIPVRVPGWRVVFDKPPLIPIGEAFANLIPDAAGSALGVAFEVTFDDLEHIELTEGVLIGNYHRVIVPVEPLVAMDDPPATACSLSSDRSDPALKPSVRYMTMIVAGATEHGLPAEYLEILRAIATCEESPMARAFRPIGDAVMGMRRK